MLTILALLLLSIPVSAPDGVDAALATFKVTSSPSKSLETRVQAVEALAKNADPRVAAALVEALELQDRRQADVQKELAELSEKLAPLHKAQLLESQWALRDQLEAQRKRASERLSAEDSVTRALVAGIAGMPAGKPIEPILDACRRHASAFVRANAIEGLARTTGDAASEALAQALTDHDARVRVAALDACGVRREAAMLVKVAACLKDDSWPVRSATLAALTAMGDVRAVGAMLPLLDKEEGRLRDDLVHALEALTKEKLGFNPQAWRDWWQQHGAAPAAAAAPVPKPTPLTTGSKVPLTYHGIATRSRSIVFVVDISDSMREGATDESIGDGGQANREGVKRSKFDVAKAELIRAINALDEKGSFDVVFFNDVVLPWQPKLVPSNRKNKDDAIAAVNKSYPSAGTNIFDALETAFGMAGGNANAGAGDKYGKPLLDTIFLLSDGAPSTGRITDTGEILKAIAEMNKSRKIIVHTIGMGKLHDAKFMSQLASDNGGQYISLK
ncbi:MAG: HEAT repeat domain-containing protein [Planctomycetes bacterium]|nr:HEAT repeat domain-containing protein [Planctomycetota bacterium]